MITLFDTATEHQLELLRYDADVREQVAKLLRQAGIEVETLINGVRFDRLTDFQSRRARQLLAQIKATLGRGYGEIAELMDEQLAALVTVQAQWGVEALAPALGISFAGLPGPDVLEALARGKLIQGTLIEDWWLRHEGSMQFRGAGIIRSGIVNGATNDQIARSIRDLFDIAQRDAMALVRTAVQSVANEAMTGLYQANSDIVQGYVALATLDSRTTIECAARNLLRWDLDGRPDGHSLPFRKPPLHWNCRTVLLPWLKSDGARLGGGRSSDEGYVDADLSFDAFLKRKDRSYLDQMLGRGRAQLYLDKKLTLIDLLDQRGNRLPLDELKRKAARIRR
ncbi:minor capsid protein [Chromobacterium haemolyticum]|uniref:minor capsid protein n=1 Tax=Chromobacterium haemolyticum TaxID=394935 RepID=UPI0013194E54|nr:minor capsid protein [Chromobacterium haemolyticum]BBH12901.1 head morphogenesis protein [Chromobacterium haemolyticum]